MEDEVRSQANALAKLMLTIKAPTFIGSALNEALYTASENGLFGDIESLDTKTALKIWLVVETARTMTADQIKEIRM